MPTALALVRKFFFVMGTLTLPTSSSPALNRSRRDAGPFAPNPRAQEPTIPMFMTSSSSHKFGILQKESMCSGLLEALPECLSGRKIWLRKTQPAAPAPSTAVRPRAAALFCAKVKGRGRRAGLRGQVRSSWGLPGFSCRQSFSGSCWVSRLLNPPVLGSRSTGAHPWKRPCASQVQEAALMCHVEPLRHRGCEAGQRSPGSSQAGATLP